MRPVLVVAPPGYALPTWLATRQAKGKVGRIDWVPGTRFNPPFPAFEAVVIAGWNDSDVLLGILASANIRAMEPAPLPVGLLETAVPAVPHPAIECHVIDSNGDPELDWSRFLGILRKRSLASRLILLLATMGLLLVSALMGAGLMTLWAAGYDPALQRGLMLIDGLEGARPRLLHGESFQALHDRMKGIESWKPDSVASGEIADRVGRAGMLLIQWLAPLDEAASWPEVEDAGTLERLKKLGERVVQFNPEVPLFSDAPLGREAMARREEILKSVVDATRQIQITRQRVESRREFLALARYRSGGEPDWSGWFRDSAMLLRETAEVPADSPVMALRDVRQALFLERESIVDLSRARKMVEMLGLAGPGPALLVPPASGADAALATHRLAIVQEMEGLGLQDFSAVGLPSVFVGALRNHVERCRAGWLTGGGKQVLELIRPLAGGIGAWRESVGKSRGFPMVSGWNQLVGVLCRMAESEAEVPPLDRLERFLGTAEQPLVPKEAVVEVPQSPSAEMVLILENTSRTAATVQLTQSQAEKRNGVWVITFRADADAKLVWFPGEPCSARLKQAGKDQTIWRGPPRQVLGTEGIWGKSAAGIPARLRWMSQTVPEPPAWFVEAIR